MSTFKFSSFTAIALVLALSGAQAAGWDSVDNGVDEHALPYGEIDQNLLPYGGRVDESLLPYSADVDEDLLPAADRDGEPALP